MVNECISTQRGVNNMNEVNKIWGAIEWAWENYKDRTGDECHFDFGEPIYRPRQFGCFQRHNSWFVYVVDDNPLYINIKGPFDSHGAISALLLTLHAKRPEEYKFTSEERDIYINTNFKSLSEIDAYIKK